MQTAPMRTLEKTNLLRSPEGKQPKGLVNMPEAAPLDRVEHFRKMKCDKGHSNWDPNKVVYSIDHRAYVLSCLDCDEDFIIPAGGMIPLPDQGLLDNAKK